MSEIKLKIYEYACDMCDKWERILQLESCWKKYFQSDDNSFLMYIWVEDEFKATAEPQSTTEKQLNSKKTQIEKFLSY